jgi:predicted dehydrogenase
VIREVCLKAKFSDRWRKPYKFVLVGCGKIGYSYATVIERHPGMELAAVIDVNSDAARAFGSSFRSRVYNSLEDYVTSERVADCALICTPPTDHMETSCRLMKKGIHVLCEQPFALDSASAEEMIDVAYTCSVRLLMASRPRFVADIIHTKGLIQAGILGRVLEFEGDFRDLVDMRNRWNIRREISGGGVLIESGGSAIDVAGYLFGHLLGVRAAEASRIQSADVEDTVRLDLRTISGILGTVHLSWNLKNAGDDYFRIYGTHGTLCIGWKKSMYRPNEAKDWINFGEGYNTLRTFARQMSHLIDVVSGEENPEISAGDVIESVRTIEAAYQSLQTGQFVKIHPATKAAGTPLGARKFSALRSPEAPTSA